ncbi:RNA cytosine-C(5)-methyltransferase NSUN2-like isoform X2 [Phoenix dactylifera]|uniref:RNA cytosine-C(5)-methyltransferase NSUN2-like isoform X2 n=1 Tax=Phoenix dactylifera TaxID=42345 RepID=A0A8B9B2Z4_PHODC|nr:RNA cytosine-C(5)-methyltransferase NSUN2-like isoform X2 [Phoenix dactylifera]
MGGGQKRGRTQRRHFKQNRDNVWKHNPKKTHTDGPTTDDPNRSWETFANQNPGFEEYYKEQGIVPEDEWEEFLSLLRKPLPAAFRINASSQFFPDILSQLGNDFMKSLEAEVNDEHEIEAIRPLPWYPGNLAWHLNFSRMQLRKNQALERFHEFLKQENEVGNITRQEAVSMVPPLFLDVLPNHCILDMCAAPGSKTFQLLEIIHQSTKPGLLPNGLIIANDVDVQRCNLLIHQTKRMCSANLIVTNHEAQHFPSCALTMDHMETFKGGQEELKANILQFDRVLCDVPCSGDGTLRKAPDIWRKWNAGMGNGIHRLQVEIAMRGIALLKVGGRMVYSTCSMNPVEDEAVVAEILRRSGGSVELVDVSSELPELIRRPGLKTWKVKDKGLWLTSYKDVPIHRRSVISPSMFPSNQSCRGSPVSCDGAQEEVEVLGTNTGKENITNLRMRDQDYKSKEHETHCGDSRNNKVQTDTGETAKKLEEVSSNKSPAAEELDGDSKVEFSTFPLERCMRILPHDQNSGAFFISVLQKLSHLHASDTKQSNNIRNKVSAAVGENHKDELKAEIKPSEDLHHQTVAEAASSAKLIGDQSKENSNTNNMCSKVRDSKEVVACGEGETGQVGKKNVKGKLQIQGKWRGVDPVVLFTDETTINSIRSFYGINECFALDGHLVTRNNDANHMKRIYYVSKSVHDILQLNFSVGQRLKITSLGLKIFERQKPKDDSSPCLFRLSSEGLPLLLPYISKQILYASFVDFQHLLQYRTVKFADFVDASFGEKASNLMSGCCVVVLNEDCALVAGNQITDNIVADASTIAIVCWKGKTNVSILVSPLDAKELLERLAVRFGSERGTLLEENETNSEIDTIKNSEDAESTDDFEMADQEGL